jgi:hypothetical protein
VRRPSLPDDMDPNEKQRHLLPGRSGKLLLVLASTVIFCSKSRGTHDHILLCHVSGSWANPYPLLPGFPLMGLHIVSSEIPAGTKRGDKRNNC